MMRYACESCPEGPEKFCELAFGKDCVNVEEACGACERCCAQDYVQDPAWSDMPGEAVDIEQLKEQARHYLGEEDLNAAGWLVEEKPELEEQFAENLAARAAGEEELPHPDLNTERNIVWGADHSKAGEPVKLGSGQNLTTTDWRSNAAGRQAMVNEAWQPWIDQINAENASAAE